MIKIFVQGLIFNENNEVLLLRRQNTGYMDGCWGTPGGHLDPNESITTAFEREMKEEINLSDIKDYKLVAVITRYNTEDTYIDFVFKINDANFDMIENNEPEKCSQLHFWDLKDVTINTVPHIRELLARYNDISNGQTLFLTFDENSDEFKFDYNSYIQLHSDKFDQLISTRAVLTIDEFINLLSDFKYNIMEEQYRNFEYDLLVELGKSQFILTYEKICGDKDNIINFRILNMSAL